jgi:hypothetical protein
MDEEQSMKKSSTIVANVLSIIIVVKGLIFYLESWAGGAEGILYTFVL